MDVQRTGATTGRESSNSLSGESPQGSLSILSLANNAKRDNSAGIAPHEANLKNAKIDHDGIDAAADTAC